MATGTNNREISQCLFISEPTVKMHLASIFLKLQVNDRTKAAILALKVGLSTAPLSSPHLRSAHLCTLGKGKHGPVSLPVGDRQGALRDSAQSKQ